MPFFGISPDIRMGGLSGSPEDHGIVPHIAGETLVRNDYVFLADPDAPYTYIDGIVPGRVYKTTKLKRHCSINAELCGFVVGSATVGQSVGVRVSGNMAGFSGLVAGATYQPADTAGTIERLENHRAALPNPVATAISTTELMVWPQKWGVRGKGWALVNLISYAFSFASDSMATSASMTLDRYGAACSSSGLKLYASGGGTGTINTIDALTFSTELFADVGDLTVSRGLAGAGSSAAKQYTGGGHTGVASNVIDQIGFVTEGNSVDVGDLTVARYGDTSVVSPLKSYWCGGNTTGDRIDALTYAAEGNAALIGAMSIAKAYRSGLSSRNNGYLCGGATAYNGIDKMPFATEVSAVIASVLSLARYSSAPMSSAIRACVAGGSTGSDSSVVDQIIFATDVVSVTTPLLTARANLGGSAS